MKVIVVLVAPSRSGKDSLGRILMDYLPDVSSFKWAAHVKRVVEMTYGLPEGSLEDDLTRNRTIPGTTTTYLQILVDFYHSQEQLSDRSFWKRPAMAELENLMVNNRTIVSTDTRDTFEVSTIINLAYQHNYRIVPVRLRRENTQGLTSDRLLETNFSRLTDASEYSSDVTISDSSRYIQDLEGVAGTVLGLAYKASKR